MTSEASPDPTTASSLPAADAASSAVKQAVKAPVENDPPSSGQVRRRQRSAGGRRHRIYPVYTDEELEPVVTAAALAGLTPAAYVAKCSVDVATARVRPAPTAMVDAIGELLQARFQVQKFSTLVNQAMKKWHSTNELPPELMRAVDLVVRVLPLLEEAAGAVRLAQGGPRRRAVTSRRRAKTDQLPAQRSHDSE